MMPLLKTVFRWWLRFVAVGLVVGFPALAVFDRFSPWPTAVEALSADSRQSRVCIGYGTHSERTPTASYSSVQRSFLLIPRALTSPSIITVTATDGAAVVVTESRFTFWFVVAIYLIALIFCVRLFRAIISTRHAQSTDERNAPSNQEPEVRSNDA